MLIAYAKGARTFERHIDIDYEGVPVSPYCTLPEQADQWFKAFKKAQEMCGAPGTAKRLPPRREIEYLDQLVRGVYAKTDLPAGHVLNEKDVYLAIPLAQGSDFLPRTDARRNAAQPDQEGCAHSIARN